MTRDIASLQKAFEDKVQSLESNMGSRFQPSEVIKAKQAELQLFKDILEVIKKA